nr:class II fructose-bisphosphate aldolase [Nesterenkonia massiliensis]
MHLPTWTTEWSSSVAIATPDKYNEMIDAAKAGGYAFPAVNVTSSQTLNAAIRGFAEAESDGIIQVSTGGAAYWSGPSIKDMVAGSLGFAAFAKEVAKNYGVNIALHTDHCPKDKLDGFVLPLLEASEAEVKAGRDPIFNSHMWDGSAETLEENLRIAAELLERTAAAKQILEVEIGTVGGEEDGVENEINEKLYTTVEDAVATLEALGTGDKGRYITALTFGNVHGVYKPGNVKLRPEILKDIQEQTAQKFGKENPFDLVFHGGSGSTEQEIADAVSFGVIKMNIDTDTQYAFTRPVADHMLKNYDGVLKVDGEVGNKKTYDPRVWGAKAEENMAARIVEAAQQLGSAGKSIG